MGLAISPSAARNAGECRRMQEMEEMQEMQEM
jgi:hypothetical protein